MTTAIARVFVNEIEVGTLPADQYQQIVKAATGDWKLYVVLAWCYIEFGARIMSRWMRFVMMSWGGAIIFVVLFQHQWLASAIEAFRTASPSAISAGLDTMLSFSTLLAFLGWGLCKVMGLTVGPRFVSPFDVRISRDVRRLLEVPAEGSLAVHVVSVSGHD